MFQKKYNKKIGELGENIAKNFLIKNGYQIIDTNIQVSYGEIDIIACKDYKYDFIGTKKFTIFIEVKTRTSNSLGRADESMTPKKMKNLRKYIRFYINRNPVNSNFIRLDLIAIDLDKKTRIANLKHYKDLL